NLEKSNICILHGSSGELLCRKEFSFYENEEEIFESKCFGLKSSDLLGAQNTDNVIIAAGVDFEQGVVFVSPSAIELLRENRDFQSLNDIVKDSLSQKMRLNTIY